MKKFIWTLLRLSLGFIFIWPFADKLLGLGFNTAKEAAWINGGSPTTGFLTNAIRGPFAEFFQSLAGLSVSGVNIIDWIFMLGLLGVGISLILNKLVPWGAAAGSAMLLLMWLAVLPPEHNPFINDHIIYTLMLVLLAYRSKERIY